METSEFSNLLFEKTIAIEKTIEEFLPEEEGPQKTVIEAMNYSIRAGGKRLRPLFMKECFLMCDGTKEEMLHPFLAAIEMIHTYSLVHDDLPAMDNDRYRRGKETTWAVYGDGMGVLAGDGLLNFAFETAMKAFDTCSSMEEFERVRTALALLGHYSGIYGMIGGQTADIEAEESVNPLTEESLLFIHAHKTAALIQASMAIGGILAGATEGQVEALKKIAYNIGVAFQIEDDILDVVGDTKELGKQVGSDAQNGKQTYVTLKGLEASQREVERLTKEAEELLKEFSGEHAFLEQLIFSLVHRRK